MLTKNCNAKISINEMVFTISYTLFVISFFVLDIEQNTFDFSTVSSCLRYVSLAVGIIGVFAASKISKRNFLGVFFVFVFGIVSFLLTHSTFFIGVAVLSIYAYRIPNRNIIKLTLKIVVVATILVVLLQCFGIFENVLTKRWINTDISTRSSFGFYHSNVLPLIFLYITAYTLILKGRAVKIWTLAFFMLGAVFLYFLCDSRNAVFGTVLMCILLQCNKYLMLRKGLVKVFNFLAKYIVLISALFSIGGALLLTKIPILETVNVLLSNRFTYALKMIDQLGLHFVSHIYSETYFGNLVVIDNGYLLCAVRYGLLYILMLVLISFFLGESIQNNTFLCIVMVVIATTNIIDNDLFDYSCLPFLLIAIKTTINKGKLKLSQRRL